MLRLLLIFLIVLSQKINASAGINQAELYEKNSSPQKEHALLCLKNFDIDQEDSVLDIGCGDGMITSYIAHLAHLGFVLGLDISKEMIQLASQKYQQKNLFFMHGSGDQIPFNQKFDKVTSFMSFHWIENQKEALEAFYMCLKPGGKLFITMPAECPGRASVAMQVVSQRKEWQPFFNNQKMIKYYLSLESFTTLLKDAAFEIESIDLKEGEAHFQNVDAYRDWVRPLITEVNNLSIEQQAQYLEDVIEELLRIYPENSDGTLTRPYQTLNVVAKK